MQRKSSSASSARSACITACEACVLACSDCADRLRPAGEPQQKLLYDLTVCIQVCELALHAMTNDGAMASAACAASARCCEALARECMLLHEPHFRLCVRACYRAAQECSKAAQARGRALPRRRELASVAEIAVSRAREGFSVWPAASAAPVRRSDARTKPEEAWT